MKNGGVIREEIPAALWETLAPRVRLLARSYRADDIEGLLRAVYLQGVRDAAETLARSGAVVTWPAKGPT